MIASEQQMTRETNTTPRYDRPTPSAGVPYAPSPREIEQQCREIRRGWSEQEHRRRASMGGKLLIAISPCRLSLADLREAGLL